MGWYKGECLPVAFVLLGGKKQTTYRRMIKEFQNACLEYNNKYKDKSLHPTKQILEFRPRRILIDFEEGAIEAFSFFFPSTTIIGCFFHFGQCLWRKFNELGLKTAYAEDEKLKEWFKTCVALAFVPHDKVENVFVDHILDEANYEEYPQLERFTDYMLKTWIDTPIFSIALWNHFQNAEIRVNNNNEGYNSRFNDKCSAPHPNLWKFIELIQEEEYLLVQIRYSKLKAGTYRSRGRDKNNMSRDIDILRIKNKYLLSVRSSDDLLDLLKSSTIMSEDFE